MIYVAFGFGLFLGACCAFLIMGLCASAKSSYPDVEGLDITEALRRDK
jgi:hypothetical protein